MTRALVATLDVAGFALACCCIFVGALLLFVALVAYAGGTLLVNAALQMRGDHHAP